MRRPFFLLTTVMGLLSAAEGDRDLSNVFTLYGDFAYFKRELALRHKLVIDTSETNCNCRFVSCDTRNLAHRFGFEPGFKVGSTYITTHTVWDFFYLWLPPWEAGCSKTSPTGSLIFSVRHPDLAPDFDGADFGQAHYVSQFQNCELNFYRYWRPRFTDYFAAAWMAGGRYINLKEAVNVSFTKEGSSTSYRVHTENHIPGLQIGGLIAWNPTSRISWDFVAKVGMGFDFGGQQTHFSSIRNYEKTGFSVPLIAEADISFSCQLTSYLDIHGAYQVIYLSGVALAPDQIVKHPGDSHVYRPIGSPLIHGLTAGFGWSF